MSIKRSIVIGEKDTATGKKEERRLEGKVAVTAKGKAKPVMQAVGDLAKTLPPRTYNPDGKTLVIVESPAKSKTIEKFLGPEYIVKASMGHLRDLPKSQLGIDIENGFIPRYSNLTTRKKLIEELLHDADESKAILLATDPDREGEAISWHLAYILNVDEASKCRITFNEITKHAVAEAINSPRTIDKNMVDAQQARRMLDRIVGYKLSPLLWRKVCKGLSAGRVQSVAVRLICEREREIQAFIPEEYWSIEGQYMTVDKESFTAELTHKGDEKITIPDEAAAEAIKADLAGKTAEVIKVERRKRSRKAPAPFTTSTLQQEGVRKLNFGAKRTMMIAQHLYEGLEIGGYGHVGLITYMRTDSTRIAVEMQQAAKTYILNHFGKEYYPAKPNVFGTKESSQDAHEAIRPTSLELPPKMVEPFLSRDELKLYTLIWNRFMASQMAPQQSETVTAQLQVGDYKLRASGSKVVFKGFTEVYEEAKKDGDEPKLIPIMAEGDTVANKEILPEQHFTQPPARYSEASLIKTLEERGIGRPSTYAPIIDTIMSRNYVEKQDKQFVPTELGFVVVDFLIAHFEKFINVDFTVHLEKDLDDIASGEETYQDVLSEFYTVFAQELDEANEVDKVKIADEESDVICDVCGNPMVYKFGRFGRFLACSNFPECKNTKPITVSTGVTCPKCHEGTIVERKSKRGRIFYGCDRYPACDFTLWNKPINETCETCGSIMTEKTYKNGTTKKFCSNENCPTQPKKRTRKKKADEGEKNTTDSKSEE
ncbi:type I DNA topoisomerase [Veillonella ratti]|uniref:type I DNA topoisomerase n=1 Tax=Veillonella ratti TaxID=103892 RepID=UPI000F8F07B7